MKSTFYFLGLLLLLSTGSVSATVFRVNNGLTQNTSLGLFNQIQTALDDFKFKNGDTLMVESSAIDYRYFTCNKRVVIIGPGYFLGDNIGVNSVAASARLDFTTSTFSPGSEGSYFIGMELNVPLSIGASNVYILRCKGGFNFSYSSATPTSNCKLIDSYCTEIGGSATYNSNISVTNCIIGRDNLGSSYLSYDNNILVGKDYTWQITAGTFRNNILIERDAKVDIRSPNFQNNLAQNQQFGTSNGNITYDPANLFVGGTSSDGKYRIKSTSPYITAGYGGTQPGIFGGSEPYMLSGVPPIPIIYELNVPGTGSAAAGLQINVKIRGAN
ncbi:hypothetical protein [Fibrella forsythiae]|uniref:Uncharacterized protein n=1 Tax=Fibrella forsythiae TaxID=2817061 RepID=A0ABS3JLL9_9BACT|nr:hypothetical protein [Fibrella forsythiae]MBO0950906.1 hypothetical protein [Fibrella forsythiae]